jgi:organic hydroperoxide reductase OsmC/OhrA
MKNSPQIHQYIIELKWTGNLGTGTSSYEGYSRDHKVRAVEKPWIMFSSDPSFRGNPANYNPEEMLVASLSSCHMLWYLHLCAQQKIKVVSYEDNPIGKMVEKSDGSGYFQEVTLKPKIIIEKSTRIKKAISLHERAHSYCFIANSVNFPVRCEAEILVNNT